MKRVRVLMFIAAMATLLIAFGRLAVARAEVTTTLLPTSSESIPADQSKLLRIKADANNMPEIRGRLAFDLGVIPVGATIKEATLQLVADRGDEVQEVHIFPDGGIQPVGRWTSRNDKCCTFAASSDPLRQRVEEAFTGKKPLSLTLQSISTRSDWKYYSMGEYGGNSSYKPRLIVKYEPPPDLVEQQQQRDTAGTYWRFFPRPAHVKAKAFLENVKLISNPVFYRGGIYVFAQPASQEMVLYALYPGGANLWGPKEIKVSPGPHALVTSTGRLYSVGENRIVIYDLEQEGAEIKNVTINNFKPVLRPTLGADGSLFAMPSGSGYIYGFNPDPQELWRYPSDNTQIADASRVTLSPDAGRYAYVLTQIGKETHPVRIETATGTPTVYDLKVRIATGGVETVKDLGSGSKGLHRPVVIKEHEYVFLSAYAEQNGIIVAQSGGQVIWWNEGPVSAPIADREQNKVLTVQNGGFRVYDKLSGKEVCSSSEANLATTSNLVMDGDGNVYFWNNGTLLGFTNDCRNFLNQKLAGLPRDLELMFAPDGSLYAWTDSNRLYTITPSRPALILDMATNKPQTDTTYSAEVIQVAANVQIKNENIMLKAQHSMSFGNGFSVSKGARVRCRIGY